MVETQKYVVGPTLQLAKQTPHHKRPRHAITQHNKSLVVVQIIVSSSVK